MKQECDVKRWPDGSFTLAVRKMHLYRIAQGELMDLIQKSMFLGGERFREKILLLCEGEDSEAGDYKFNVPVQADRPQTNALSPREYDVLRSLLVGRSDPEIAAHLGIAINTVKRHNTSIYQKLEINGRSGLTPLMFAIEQRCTRKAKAATA